MEMDIKMNHEQIFGFNPPLIMGILNVTPDSFSDGGLWNNNCEKAVEHALQMVEEGAAIIDIGAESTRPGSEPVSLEEEAKRLFPVLDLLIKKNLPISISVDTYKPEIAAKACQMGVKIINDIHGIRPDVKMAEVAKKYHAYWILMDDEPLSDMENALNKMENAVNKALDYGLEKNQLLIDPGLGFNKSAADNIIMTKAIPHYLDRLQLPLVYGPSRKRFLRQIVDNSDLEILDRATAASCAIACSLGAEIVRVHNVTAVKEAIKVGAAFL